MFPISQHATRRCLIDRNPEQLKQRDQLARMMVVEDQWLEMGPILPDFGTRWVIGSLEWRLWNDLGSALPTSPVCLCLRSTFIGFSMLLSLQSPTEGQLLNRQKWLVELSAYPASLAVEAGEEKIHPLPTREIETARKLRHGHDSMRFGSPLALAPAPGTQLLGSTMGLPINALAGKTPIQVQWPGTSSNVFLWSLLWSTCPVSLVYRQWLQPAGLARSTRSCSRSLLVIASPQIKDSVSRPTGWSQTSSRIYLFFLAPSLGSVSDRPFISFYTYTLGTSDSSSVEAQLMNQPISYSFGGWRTRVSRQLTMGMTIAKA